MVGHTYTIFIILNRPLFLSTGLEAGDKRETSWITDCPSVKPTFRCGGSGANIEAELAQLCCDGGIRASIAVFFFPQKPKIDYYLFI